MYLALARERRRPARARARARCPAIPEDCQWAHFVRNHDELTLDKLTEDEREEVFAAFGPDEDMQLYGRGLRRRLPAMLGGDQRRIRLVYSLVFSLPGHARALLRRGDRDGREPGDRGPLQRPRARCSGRDERHGGFTTAEEPVRPLVPTAAFGGRRR